MPSLLKVIKFFLIIWNTFDVSFVFAATRPDGRVTEILNEQMRVITSQVVKDDRSELHDTSL